MIRPFYPMQMDRGHWGPTSSSLLGQQLALPRLLSTSHPNEVALPSPFAPLPVLSWGSPVAFLC